MRHVKQKKDECGVACVAMVAGVSYTKARQHVRMVKAGGTTSGRIITALRKLTRFKNWKLLRRSVPVFMRHYTPRITEGIIVLAAASPTGFVYGHFIAISGNRIFDPDQQKSVTIKAMKLDKRWRSWMVTGEIGRV